MQTTLLGLALAFILALLAALVGPLFMDWNQFRSQFEREVARATGMQVRIDGKIDARLLPSPSLSLRDVAIGERLDANNISVEKLDVELSLGDLMRGEWRATELSLSGLVLEIGLDPAGRMKWNAAPGNFSLSAVTVDRFSVTGAIAVLDAASNTSFRFDNIAFGGEVRGLAGSLRGEGAVTFRGTRYPFRLSTGRAGEANAQRVRLNVDPLRTGFGVDLDGVMSLQNLVPHFDGSLSAGRSVAIKSARLDPADMPWRVTTRVKADPSAARLEQLEAALGTDELALKLAGDGSVRFGASPLLRTQLSARQIDVDRFFTQGGTAAPSPGAFLAGLRHGIESLPRMPMASEIGIAVDVVNFGPRPVQALDLDLKADNRGWSVETLQFRAPGGTRVSLSGRVAESGEKADFSGDLKLDVNDPAGLALWLQGTIDNTWRAPQPLRIAGKTTVSRQLLAIDGMTADINGQMLAGRAALATASDGKTRLEAALTAPKLDAEIAGNVLKMAGGFGQKPDAASLALDIGQIELKELVLKPVSVGASYNADSVVIDRLRIGDADGVAIDGRGALNIAASTGQLNLSATSASLDPLSRLLAPVAPAFAVRLSSIPAGAGNVWAGLTVDLEKAQGNRAGLRAALDIRSPRINGALTASFSPPTDRIAAFDVEGIAKGDAAVTARLSADNGGSLLSLLNLDQTFAADGKPLLLEASAKGAWGAPLTVKAKLSGESFDGDIEGTVQPSGDDTSGTLNVVVRKVDIAPLLGHARRSSLNASVTSRLAIAPRQWTFDGLDVSAGGSRLRGKLQLTHAQNPAEPAALNGEIGIDALDVPSVMLGVLGAPSFDATEPFARGPLARMRGRISFSSLKASLGALELRPLSGTVSSDGQGLLFENLSAGIGGGQIKGDVAVKSSTDGTSVGGRVQLSGVDGATLRYRSLQMPAGKISAQVAINGTARSASAITTALAGTGAVRLEKAPIPGLDPRAFDVALKASDDGTARDDMMLGAIVAPALSAGALRVASAELPFTVRDGQLRVGNTAIAGEGAQLNLSGGYDIVADQIDIRAVLSTARADAASAGRADITVLVFGSPDRPERSVDVAALSSWLALRAIDRETKRLDAIERTNPLLNPSRAPAGASASVPPPAHDSPPQTATIPSVQRAPDLPPPIEIKPAPAPRQLPRNAPLVIAPMQRPAAGP